MRKRASHERTHRFLASLMTSDTIPAWQWLCFASCCSTCIRKHHCSVDVSTQLPFQDITATCACFGLAEPYTQGCLIGSIITVGHLLGCSIARQLIIFAQIKAYNQGVTSSCSTVSPPAMLAALSAAYVRLWRSLTLMKPCTDAILFQYDDRQI